MNSDKLSHLDSDGNPHMVDVSAKQITARTAIAEGFVSFEEEAWNTLSAGQFESKKGPVIHTAIIAGIQGVKRCSELIPMCHPLPIDGVNIKIKPSTDRRLHITCEVKTTGKTGVEMEALTGVNIAALTVYDMCKSLGHGMLIGDVRLRSKKGGKSDFS